MYFQSIDAFGCCVEVDIVEEMYVEIVQVCEVRMRKSQGLSFFEPLFLLGHALCDYCKQFYRQSVECRHDEKLCAEGTEGWRCLCG